MKKIKNKLCVFILIVSICIMAAFESFAPANASASMSASSLDTQIERINLEGLAMLPDGVGEFEVNTYQGLYSLAKLVAFGESFKDMTVFMTSDINYAEHYPYGTDGEGSKNHVPIGITANPFCGIFDGGGFTVKIIRFSVGENESAGFFGTTSGAIIKNLIVENTIYENPLLVEYHTNFGAIVGHAKNTSVINCENKANISNLNLNGTAGGIVGYGEGFRILNCINLGKVSAKDKVGRIIASHNGSTPQMILSCMNFGEIGGDGSNSMETALIAAANPAADMSDNKYTYGKDKYGDEFDKEVDIFKLADPVLLGSLQLELEDRRDDLQEDLQDLENETEPDQEQIDLLQNKIDLLQNKIDLLVNNIDLLNNWETKPIGEKKDFINLFNEDVRAARIECARAAQINYDSSGVVLKPGTTKGSGSTYENRFRRHMQYWGLDDNGWPTVHSGKPVFDLGMMFDYTHKQTGLSALYRAYKDCVDYMNGDDDFSVQARKDLYQIYLLLTQELNDMYRGIKFTVNDNTQVISAISLGDETELDFANRVADFTNVIALEKLNPFYDAWQEEMDRMFVANLNDFAIHMISSWYNDCMAFVLGDDEIAITTRERLTARFNELLENELTVIEFEDGYADYTLAVTDFISYSIFELDNIYYEWQVGTSLEDFERMYTDTKKSISNSSVRAKIKKAYDDALAEITSSFDASEDWIGFADVVDGIVAEATSKIMKTYDTWEKDKSTTTIIVVITISAAILLVAVTALFIIMKRRENTFKTIIYDNLGAERLTRKDKKLEAKTNEISEKIRQEREKQESLAEAQRLKTEIILNLKKEKAEMQANLNRKEMELNQKNLQAQKTAELLALVEKRDNQPSEKPASAEEKSVQAEKTDTVEENKTGPANDADQN